MSDDRTLFSLTPEAFNFLRSFEAKGRVDILNSGIAGYQEKVSAALAKAVKVVCQIDREVLRKELLAKNVPKEAISSIIENLTIEGEFRLRDCGLPWHLRNNPNLNL